MFEFIGSAEDPMAVRVSDKITGADLDAMLDKLDELFPPHEKVHVFVETRRTDGIGLAGLPGYTARALPLFAKLGRFGRIAVVADQAWVRAGARIESAVLPFISYRIFTPD